VKGGPPPPLPLVETLPKETAGPDEEGSESRAPKRGEGG